MLILNGQMQMQAHKYLLYGNVFRSCLKMMLEIKYINEVELGKIARTGSEEQAISPPAETWRWESSESAIYHMNKLTHCIKIS